MVEIRSSTLALTVQKFGQAGRSRRISAIVSAPPIYSQVPERDVLLGLVVLLLAAVTPASEGGSDVDPASGLVDGAGMARRLDECLDEYGGCVVALGPILMQAPADNRLDVRAQVRDLDPGQDEEPWVVNNEGGFFSRSFGVHPMKRSRGASFLAAVLKPIMVSGQPLRSWWMA